MKSREYARKWKKENPEKAREKVRKWYIKNSEKKVESNKKWKKENPEKAKKWKKENPERVKENNRKWYKKNSEKVRENGYRKKLKTIGMSIPETIKLLPLYVSQLESIVRAAVETHFPDYVFQKNVKPSWLKNPRTNRPLELDLYCEDIKLAIEVQGQQHYYMVEKFHRTTEEFEYQLYKDVVKKNICRERGIHLVEFKYNQKIKTFLDMIQLFLDLK